MVYIRGEQTKNPLWGEICASPRTSLPSIYFAQRRTCQQALERAAPEDARPRVLVHGTLQPLLVLDTADA